MGIDLANWDAATGPLYMGANSSWEIIWTLIALLCCVVACIVGSRHELDAYKRAKKNGSE